MNNYFNKENNEKISIINTVMGTNHRNKPFDFKNADDIKEAFYLSVCEFLDYKEYWVILSDLDERFDESIENYDVTNWINMSIGEEIEDKLLIQAIKSISRSESLLYKLFNRAKQKCREIFEIILKSENNIQSEILGSHYVYDDSLVDKIFDDEGIFSLEYIYNMKEAYEAFIKYINNVLQE